MPAPQLTDLARDVLDNRARLIGQEAGLSAKAQNTVDGLVQQWLTELRATARRSGARAGELAEVQRLGPALNKLGYITDRQLASLRPVIQDAATGVYSTETFRYAEMLHSYLAEATGEIGVSFSELSRPTLKAALEGNVPGLGQVLGQTSSATKMAMRRDVADAVAKGFAVDDLAKLWGQGQGAAGIAFSRVEALAHTAIMSASNNAAIDQYSKAPDVVSMVQWEATFDSRVCLICANLHGKRFPVKKAPAMPAHFRCRCAWLPVFADDALNQQFDTRVAYQKPSGDIAFKKMDRRFDTWLDRQDDRTQRAFFPSELKYDAWANKNVPLENLISPDGSIKTDAEVSRMLRKGK